MTKVLEEEELSVSTTPYQQLQIQNQEYNGVVVTPNAYGPTALMQTPMAPMYANANALHSVTTNITVGSSQPGGCQHSSQVEKYMCCPLICIIIMTIQTFPLGLYCLCCLDAATYMKCMMCGMKTMVKSYKHIYCAFIFVNLIYLGAIIGVIIFMMTIEAPEDDSLAVVKFVNAAEKFSSG